MKSAFTSFLLLAIGSTASIASPVVIQFSGQVEEENCHICSVPDPFGGFLSLGDQYHTIIRFDPAQAIVYYSDGKGAGYDLIGATASVSINGFEFTNHPASPIKASVSNNYPYDIFTIDISTVPLDNDLKPLAAAPHGVTEIYLGLQDNSATALSSTALPTVQSKIWNAQWQRSELVHDPNGNCRERGCVNGISGMASLSVQTLQAAIPEPHAILYVALACMSLLAFRRC